MSRLTLTTISFFMLAHQALSLISKVQTSHAESAVAGDITTRQSGIPSEIVFAADDSGKLYINGVLKASNDDRKRFSTTKVNLNVGDVISIEATDGNGGYGVIAVIAGGGRTYFTGVDEWRVVNAFKPVGGERAWMKAGYNVCDWPEAGPTKVVGQAEKFPYREDGARYIWSENASGWSTVFARFRIGGEGCTPKRVAGISTILFAADDRAILFLNGVETGFTDHLKQSHSIKLRLKKGDIIAIEAHDYFGGYGLVAALLHGSKKFVTGDGSWKIRQACNTKQGESAWKYSNFNACNWSGTIAGVRTGRSPFFPFETTGAKYVWAADAGSRGRIQARFRVGGENCSGKQLKPDSKIMYTADDSASLYVNGVLIDTLKKDISFRAYCLPLSDGDVIGIEATNQLGGYGMAAAIVHSGETYATGVNLWRAKKKVEAANWSKKSYDVCDWPKTVLGKPESRSASFPFESTGADYIWASDSGNRGTILSRYRIGGEKCTGDKGDAPRDGGGNNHRGPPPEGVGDSMVTFAADTKAIMYLNGKRMATTTDYFEIKTVRLNLKDGDVIGFNVVAGVKTNGFIAVVSHNGKKFKTGIDNWKVRRGANVVGVPLEWARSWYSAWNWPKGVVSTSAQTPSSFPSALFGAKYVWSIDSWESENVYGRFRIGAGRSCDRKERPSRITFAADNRAILYVNKKEMESTDKYFHIRLVDLKLKKGDVVAIKATSTGGGFGAVALISIGSGEIATGVDKWKVLTERKWKGRGNDWAGQSFDDCSWPAAVGRRGVRRAKHFPYGSTGARYIGAPRSSGTGTIFLRLKIGGADCRKRRSSQSARSIHFAGHNRMLMFVNGEAISQSQNYSATTFVKHEFTDGDVLSVVVTGGGIHYGGVVAIEFGGQIITTGQRGWRATHSEKAIDAEEWTSHKYDVCSWKPAVVSRKVRRADGFPYERTRAQYVWAADASEKDTIFLRYTIGGDGCIE